MGEPGAKEIALVDAEDLRLPLQSAKGGGVNNTRPVVFELRAVVALGTLRLRGLATSLLDASRYNHAGLLTVSSSISAILPPMLRSCPLFTEAGEALVTKTRRIEADVDADIVAFTQGQHHVSRGHGMFVKGQAEIGLTG